MGRRIGIAPYDASGHATTCDRVTGQQKLPAYYYIDDGSCAHCGEVLYGFCTCGQGVKSIVHKPECVMHRNGTRLHVGTVQ